MLGNRELELRVWSERVDRDQRRDRAHAREYADACHNFLAEVHDLPDNGRGFFFDGVEPTEEEAAMLREFHDELGRISGAGPFPE